jgi:demethylmenaquinone methyltransferase/2-methoxy-6-polyprenyl-1,4-benzoquinol methylase
MDDRDNWDALDRDMRRYYGARAPEYDDWYDRLGRYDDPATNAAWHAEVAELARTADGFGAGRLLDIACGTGRWTVRFASNPCIASVTACDQAPEMLEQTRVRLATAGRAATLVQADAYALPFADGTFDSCFFGFFLSHVPSERLERFLGEVRRVLRPGGALLVFDSALPDAREVIQVQERPLNDGSRHRVLKVYYTPVTLRVALALAATPESIATEATGRYFVVGRGTTPS